MKLPRSIAKSFWLSRTGQFALTVALSAPLLLGLTGGVVDLVTYQQHRAMLQATADTAVLAAAKEAGLKGWSTDSAEEVVALMLAGHLTAREGGADYGSVVQVDEPTRTVKVRLTQDHFTYFVLGYFTGSPQISVNATARASGQSMVCVIVDSPTQKEAMKLSGNSKLVALGCSAYSNSLDPKGLTVKDTAKLRTQLSCTAGGYSGAASNFSPKPLTDCPPIKDPLATRALAIDRSLPIGCDHTKLKISGSNTTLSPGVYCGGLEVTGGAVVFFKPGVYVFRDGKLKVTKASSVEGDAVGLVFTGEKSVLEFKQNSTVSLTAPASGPMSGILLYAQPTAKKSRDFKIESKNARMFSGTVYLPADQLTIGGDKDGDGLCDTDPDDPTAPIGLGCESDVGAASAWTAIITKLLEVTAGANLVVNSNYDGSKIPVPEGMGPTSQTVSLAK